MRDTPSRFIEILDPKDTARITAWAVSLEDVLAHQEASTTRSRSSTQSFLGKESESAGSGSDRELGPSSPGSQRWKRISSILTAKRGS
ncbi:hypothetical protein PHISP_03588 [Aspergillus sp. HF37]|nr:hypothetical protein PHISP_03588 [Aspergillus sp. HF37]